MNSLSYLAPTATSPWHTYLSQVDRVLPYLRKIWDTADKHAITLRTATFTVACERILIAREERGLYP